MENTKDFKFLPNLCHFLIWLCSCTLSVGKSFVAEYVVHHFSSCQLVLWTDPEDGTLPSLAAQIMPQSAAMEVPIESFASPKFLNISRYILKHQETRVTYVTFHPSDGERQGFQISTHSVSFSHLAVLM